jgi:hypothetical protein
VDGLRVPPHNVSGGDDWLIAQKKGSFIGVDQRIFPGTSPRLSAITEISRKSRPATRCPGQWP